MTATPTQPKLNQARRNQAFEDRPASASAQCPLKSLEVAIFPVRYAVDESPPRGSNQGPHPLPEGFTTSHLPNLQTRSYTLRQLRDGWLYVWNETEKTLHEYSVKGHLLTQLVWAEQDTNNDIRNTPGDTAPYLLYPRDSSLYIAYSPVQWTWRICEKMKTSIGQQSQWMRKLDLQKYCETFRAPHSAELRKLAECVADISPSGEVPSFTTTLIPTQEPPADPDAQQDPNTPQDPAMQFKPGISDALVLGAVPDQDTALFVALDDPLANVNDLNMQINGRFAEIAEFEEEYRNRIHTALAVHQACGVELDAVMPEGLDVDQRLEFTADAHQFLGWYRLPDYSGMGASKVIADIQINNARNMNNKWKVSHQHPAWEGLAADWQAKETWRQDVRFDEVSQFLHERAEELKNLRLHVLKSEADLIAWLSVLTPDPECIFHDTCNVTQTAALLDWAESVAQCLGSCGKDEADTTAQDSSVMRIARIDFQGQEWLYRQHAEPSSLIGLALFNFNKELADALELIAYNFSTTGTIDGHGQLPDTNGQIEADANFWQGVLGGVGDVETLLDLPAVQNSALYQSLSDTARQSLEALRAAVTGRSQGAWNSLSTIKLPVLGTQYLTAIRILRFTLIQVLVTDEFAEFTAVQVNKNYKREKNAWIMNRQIIAKKVNGQRNALMSQGEGHTRQAVRTDYQTQLAQLGQKDSSKPQHIRVIARGIKHTRTVEYREISGLIATGGQVELQTQLHLKATNPAAYAARVKAWMNTNLGGSLPVILTGLGIWNLMVTTKAVYHDGYLTSEEQNSLVTAAASTGSMLFALWLMPLWGRAGQMIGSVEGRSVALTKAGMRAWLAEGNLAHAKLAQKLILRTAGMAALNVIASASEIVEVNRLMAHYTSREQLNALRVQRIALSVLTVGGGLQIAGSLSGVFLSFAWVMGPWMVGILAIAGLVYLIASTVASFYHREGIRLWLYQCYWGKAAISTDSDDDFSNSLWQLSQICLTPAVSIRSVHFPYWDGLNGLWMQLALPSQLAGQDCVIRYIPVGRTHVQSTHRSEITLESGVYEDFLNGYWRNPSTASANDSMIGTNRYSDQDQLSSYAPTNGIMPGDADYSSADPFFYWRTWIPIRSWSGLEIEITYTGMIGGKNKEPMRFMFRCKSRQTTTDAQLISDPLSSAPIEGELLSRSNVPALILALPTPTTE